MKISVRELPRMVEIVELTISIPLIIATKGIRESYFDEED
jgi:hypothetical protein